MPASDPTLKTLRSAAKGLTYPSETDAPVQAFRWDALPRGEALTPEALKQLAKLPADAPVKPLDLDKFFAPATATADWHGPEEQAAAAGFQALRRTLEKTLTDISAFAVGEVEKTVLVVGKTPDGHYAGVKTKVVET